MKYKVTWAEDIKFDRVIADIAKITIDNGEKTVKAQIEYPKNEDEDPEIWIEKDYKNNPWVDGVVKEILGEAKYNIGYDYESDF